MMEKPFGEASTREPGTILDDKWYILRQLGVGGMASVYEAQHRNGKRVAVKVLHPDLIPEASAVERFVREGYLTNAVDHPGVVSVLDDGVTEEGAPYLVMEFLEGEDLGHRLKRLNKPLELPDALSITVAVLDALRAAHEADIVHRDLKPDNLFLCADGAVKILDFGIARLVASARGNDKPMTELGVALGTVKFMSIEQALGQHDQINGQTDLWALGATIYYALTLHFLYESRNSTEFLAKLLQGNPRSIRQLVPEIPEDIAYVIDRALQHDRGERWQNAGAMKNALVVAAKKSGVEIPATPSLAGYEPPPRPKSRPRNLPEGLPPKAAPHSAAPVVAHLPPPVADSEVLSRSSLPTAPEFPAAVPISSEERNAATQKIRAAAPLSARWFPLGLTLGLAGALGFVLVYMMRPSPGAAMPETPPAASSLAQILVDPPSSASPTVPATQSVSATPAAPASATATTPRRPPSKTPRVGPVDIGNSRQ